MGYEYVIWIETDYDKVLLWIYMTGVYKPQSTVIVYYSITIKAINTIITKIKDTKKKSTQNTKIWNKHEIKC